MHGDTKISIKGNYSFGTQEQVEQAQELLNLPLMDNGSIAVIREHLISS